MLGQKVGGHQGDPRTRPLLPASNHGAPSPPHLHPTLESRGPASWASQSPSPTPFAPEGPVLGIPRGLGAEAMGGREGAALPSGGQG